MSSSEEHKTFYKASPWDIREQRPDAARAWCSRYEHGKRAERLFQQEQAPPDMLTGQSTRACLRREVPADHEAHSQLRRESTPEAEAKGGRKPDHGRTQRGQLQERVTIALMRVVTTLTELRRRDQRRTRVARSHPYSGGSPELDDECSREVTIASTLRPSAKSGLERMAT